MDPETIYFITHLLNQNDLKNIRNEILISALPQRVNYNIYSNMKRKILIEPDPILRKKCEPLEKVDDDIRKLMQDMLETMYDAPGIGLAAVQIGILKKTDCN